MTEKVKIAFVLPASLQAEFRQQILSDNYDMKGKSRWVAEAVEMLLTLHSFPDLVKLNDEMKGFEQFESVVLTKELKQQVDAAVIQVRKKYPALEGVQSRILRTAIMQRLLRQ